MKVFTCVQELDVLSESLRYSILTEILSKGMVGTEGDEASVGYSKTGTWKVTGAGGTIGYGRWRVWGV